MRGRTARQGHRRHGGRAAAVAASPDAVIPEGSPARCSCGAATRLRTTTVADPWDASALGLVRTALVGVRTWRCLRCGDRDVEMARIPELLRVAEHSIAVQPWALAGQEIRWLRLACSMAGNEFAALIGVSPATLSRVERGRQSFSASMDLLVRLVWAAHTGDREAATAIVAQAAGGGTVPRPAEPRLLRLRAGRWAPVTPVARPVGPAKVGAASGRSPLARGSGSGPRAKAAAPRRASTKVHAHR